MKGAFMFKWLKLQRRRPAVDVAAEARDDDRASGEDTYESEEEERREVDPSGLTRTHTDGI